MKYRITIEVKTTTSRAAFNDIAMDAAAFVVQQLGHLKPNGQELTRVATEVVEDARSQELTRDVVFGNTHVVPK